MAHRVARLLIAVALVGCRREPEAAAAPDTALRVVVPTVFDHDAARVAVLALSPAMRAKPGKRHAIDVKNATKRPTSCSPGDADCLWWEFWIADEDPEFGFIEWCQAHAVTGEVRCIPMPLVVNAQWKTVGNIAASTDAGADAPLDGAATEPNAAPARIDHATARTAVRALSPRMRASKSGEVRGVIDPAKGATPPADDCGATDVTCVWSFWVVRDAPSELRPEERCEVHAVTGNVRCADWPVSPTSMWRSVGNARAVTPDAGSDAAP